MDNNEIITKELELRKELAGEAGLETYKKNYLIEAGAGAGKTYTMVNRIINQLDKTGIEPEKIAAITFTEKATQEMLGRIVDELYKRLEDAKKAGDAKQAKKLRTLLDNVDQMQVSTIHSFCSKLLKTMPFYSPLGPDFENVEDDELNNFRDNFFSKAIAEEDNIFKDTIEITNITYSDLKENFKKLCECTAELVYRAYDVNEAREYLKKLNSEIEKLSEYFTVYAAYDEGAFNRYKSEESKLAAQEYVKMLLDYKSKPAYKLQELFRENLNPLKTSNQGLDAFLGGLKKLLPKKPTKAELKKLEAAGKESCYIDIEALMNKWRQEFGNIIHSLVFDAMDKLIAKYREEKCRQGKASSNDLLYFAKEMLHKHKEAREYFHNRYATIYVDEMQDTDPVQAQILFYLAGDEAKFDAFDWRNCCPTPGSLFLVGDPKQAIYRFRGADISVYNTLKKLFRGDKVGVNSDIGRSEVLGEVIPLNINFRSSQEICDLSDTVFADNMKGGEWQADYSGMVAKNGYSSRSMVVRYIAKGSNEEEVPLNDAKQVAGFIKQMVDDKVMLGCNDNEHEACYGDFMILTRSKKATERYVTALGKYGVPCNMAGEKTFSEILPIKRAGYILSYLADVTDETKLILTLFKCYGIALETINIYKQRVKYIRLDCENAIKAFAEENAVTEEIGKLFYGLRELASLSRQVKELPALTVLENIIHKSYAVWNGSEEDNSADYAMVCQFVEKVRAKGYINFYEMTTTALKLIGSVAERELLLHQEDNCVRIMNLHKAKGLEAEVIILAYGTASSKKPSKTTIYDGNEARYYGNIMRGTGFGSIAACSCAGWEEFAKLEKQFLDAEQLRLLYVAATRPKTVLVVNSNEKLKQKSNAPAWETIVANAGEDTQNPEWEKALQALRGEVVPEADKKDDVEKVEKSVYELDANMSSIADKVAEKQVISISPSLLENHMRGTVKVADEKESEAGTQDKSAEVTAEILQPHGADWGTIIHRIFELAVKGKNYTEAAIKELAYRAVVETIDIEDINESQRKLLLAGRTDLGTNYLVDEALAKVGFLLDENSEYRKLLDNATCYTELPFVVYDDEASELARAVAGILGETGSKPLSMNGIIDLAVLKNGVWSIVDYKTDIIRTDEDEATYVNRLKEQYTNQLRCYTDVVARMNCGEVEKLYICAVNLGGKLISIDK